jgi:hypothetical protein
LPSQSPQPSKYQVLFPLVSSMSLLSRLMSATHDRTDHGCIFTELVFFQNVIQKRELLSRDF